MGYYVRKLRDKKRMPNWKVQYISTKKKDLRPGALGHRRTWDLIKDRWRPLGFNPSMTIDEARARAKQLNSQLLLKLQEERVRVIQQKQKMFQLSNEAALPEEFVAEFEQRFIRAKGILTDEQRKMRNKRRFRLWRAAQRVIITAQVEPIDWAFFPDRFYEVFLQKQFSIGYAKGILSMINLWGLYITRKMGQPFYPVPQPKGFERQRIIEAYYEKKSPCQKPSKPITHQHLEIMKPSLNSKNFNWLFISVWFGLRPLEIDHLMNEEMWRVEILPTGRKVLWIFQTKIIALPVEDRWKPIPILFDEQNIALKMITDKNFKRPLPKTIHYHIGQGHNLYGGRKGFVDLMLSRNQILENISIWMGHSTLSRTWRSYKNKQMFKAS